MPAWEKVYYVGYEVLKKGMKLYHKRWAQVGWGDAKARRVTIDKLTGKFVGTVSKESDEVRGPCWIFMKPKGTK